MKTKLLFPRLLNLLASVFFLLLISSCDSKSKKQFQLAEQCVENNEYEEAIKLLSSIKQTSNYYEEAQQLICKAFSEEIIELLSNQQYSELSSILDTISPESPLYNIVQWASPFINVVSVSINYLGDKSTMNENTLGVLDNSINILERRIAKIEKGTVDISKEDAIIISIFSMASYIKSLFYYDVGKYEKSLQQLENLWETLETNNVGKYNETTQQLEIAESYASDSLIIIHSLVLKTKVLDSIHYLEKRRQEERREQDIRTIKTLISNIGAKDYFDGLHNSDDPLDLISELQEFQEYWKMIDRMGSYYSEDEIVCSHVKKLKSELVRVQKREFPILRKRVAKILSQKLWLDNIDVYCSGNNNNTINLVGYGFASNAYAAKAQDSFEPIFKEFKFKKSHYYWYRGSEYINFNINSSDDCDRVYVYVNTSF